MHRLIVVALLVVALPLHNRLVEAGPASKEAMNQQGSCGGMISPPPPPPGGGPPPNPQNLQYPCPLLNTLQHYCTCGCTQAANGGTTVGLSVSDQEILQAWINETETFLIGCGGVINETVIVEVSVSLQMLCMENPSIAVEISYLSINDSSGAFWGVVQDFINVQVSLQFSIVSQTLAVGPSGTCPLQDAISAAASACGNATIQSECQQLNEAIQSCVTSASLNETSQLAAIYEIITVQFPELVEFLQVSVNIEAFGSFASFFSVCQVNFQVQQMAVYMAGPPASCPFMADINAIVSATCQTSAPNNTQCAAFTSLQQSIQADLSASVSIEVRMEEIANLIFSMCQGTPYSCAAMLPGCGCSLYEFVFCSSFCHNEGCCAWNGPPPSLPPPAGGPTGATASGVSEGVTEEAEASTATAEVTVEVTVEATAEVTVEAATSEAPTTEAATSEAAATSKAPTTEAAATSEAATTEAAVATTEATQGTTQLSQSVACITRVSIIEVVVSCNCSSFLQSIIIATNKWAAGPKGQILSLINQMKAVIYNNPKKFSTAAAQINQLIVYINSWLKSFPADVTLFNSIVIYEQDMTTEWGLASLFCQCGNATAS